MPGQPTLDHASNVYIAVTLSSNSPAFSHPELLAGHPALTRVGQVGELRDVQLLSVPKDSWTRVQDEILSSLNGMDGVRRVEVQQPPSMRIKRGDEF